MGTFLKQWGDASFTSLGFFWMALWAFALGYFISSMIQVFVTEERMQKTMGENESKGMLLGTFFGFISSSCSFAALATTKSLFQKGASFLASLAFLLASTNLVIELGVLISIFLGWQFVAAEYVGGVLLILVSWLLVKLTRPDNLIKKARKNLEDNSQQKESEDQEQSFTERASKLKNWALVSRQYAMEWKMVWKDVTVGFTIAGIVAAFVPDSFFQTLFISSGNGNNDFSFFEILQHTVVGPVAAFLTFIGSMGNIPLAALLFERGVSFAGVMAFIFSDLVVFPVLRINAKYYGWKMAFFILFLLFTSLVVASLLLHYGFSAFHLLPHRGQVKISDSQYFKINYTFFLNLFFLLGTGVLIWLGFKKFKDIDYHKEMAPKSKILEMVLKYLSFVCYAWLVVGIILHFAV